MEPPTLRPVLYKIEQEYLPHVYYIEEMKICSQPLWYVLLRKGDPSAYLPYLKDGYETAELALDAWKNYAETKLKLTNN